MNQLVVLSTLLAVAFAAPSGLYYAAAPAPVVPVAPAHVVPVAPAVAHVVRPAVYSAPAVALSKTVHYAPTPVVTGYTSTVVKPNLGLLATPAHTVTKSAVLAPARPVDTVVPQVTHVQPEVAVKSVPYDVPVHTPYVSHVEVKANPTPVVVPAPVHVAPAVVPAPVAVAPAFPVVKAAAPVIAPVALPAPVPAVSLLPAHTLTLAH